MVAMLKKMSLAALAVSGFSAAPAAAQDVLPDAPSEVRDFRIDEPQPAPRPETQPAPPPTAPAPQTESATPAVTQPAAPSPSARPQVRSNAPPAGRPAARPAPAAVREQPQPTPAANSQAATQPNTPADTGAAAASTTPTDTQNDNADANGAQSDESTIPSAQNAPTAAERSTSWIWLAVAGGLALLLLGGWLTMKRRKAGNEAEPKAPLPTDREKRDTAEAQPAREQKTEPAPAVKPDPAPTTKPPETATDVDKAAKPAKQRSGPELEIQFKPESATLGLANLMLRGELKVVNIGKAMARNVTLTSGAICAGPKQEQAIAEFFEDDIVAQPIDNIRKGEKLSIEIEIMMPRGELASYAFQGREICVPIILAELSYTGIKEGSDRGARLATIIGCEAKPKAEKLGPLRLDQGPRSFSELGQREIAV